MITVIARYGIIGGLIVAVPMLWLMLTVPATTQTNPLGGMLVSYLTMLVALTTVYFGIKHYRDRTLGGEIRFLQALGLGLAISAVASTLYVVGWEISIAHSNFDFVRWYADYIVDAARSSGASAAQMAKAAAEVNTFKESYANPLLRIPMTFLEIFPVGVLVSVVSALALRRRQPKAAMEQ